MEIESEEKILIGLQMEGKDGVFYVHLTPAQIEEISTDENKYNELYYSLKNEDGLSQSNHENKPQKWNDNSIKLLLELRLGMEAEFINPKGKKRKLSSKIAQEIKNIGGVQVSEEECDLKYRNLLSTYRKNKEKKSKTGESKITWEYFEKFDEVLGHKASSCPPFNLLTSSVTHENKNEEEKKKKKTDDQTKKLLPTPKKKKEMSMGEYLAHRKEMDVKRWDEKKKLKEQEIDAIKLLAAAIAGPSGNKNINTKQQKSKRKHSSSSDSD